MISSEVAGVGGVGGGIIAFVSTDTLMSLTGIIVGIVCGYISYKRYLLDQEILKTLKKKDTINAWSHTEKKAVGK